MEKKLLLRFVVIVIQLILILSWSLSLNAASQKHEQSKHTYKHQGGHHSFKDPDNWARMFETPERDEWQKPSQVIKILQFRGDEIVADIGSATGYFPVRFAKVLPKGRVYGVDIEKDMVDYLNNRAKSEGLQNLSSILCEPEDPNLPEPVDIVFVCNTYHHFEDRKHYFSRLKKHLKPGGRVVIVDFHKGKLPVGPPDKMKLAADTVISEFLEAGYSLVQRPEILPYQYLLIFQPNG